MEVERQKQTKDSIHNLNTKWHWISDIECGGGIGGGCRDHDGGEG